MSDRTRAIADDIAESEASTEAKNAGAARLRCRACGLPMSFMDHDPNAEQNDDIGPHWVCDGPNDNTDQRGCWGVEVGAYRPQSPEITGDYQCPKCPNRTHFIGWDHDGYGGPLECECGAYDEYGGASGAECCCSAVLRQPFTILPDGEVVYAAFEGGGCGAEIGSYDTIECAECGYYIWNEVPPEDAP